MGCSIAHSILEPRKSALPINSINHEVYYILEGTGCMHINDQEEIVQTGQSVYIPFNACQWIKNIGEEDLKFLCTVSPPWEKIDEKLC